MTYKEYEREAKRWGERMKERQAEKGSGAKIYKEYERGARREGERMKESAGKGKRVKE